MVFVAAKLVPGAGVNAIKPLQHALSRGVPDGAADPHRGRGASRTSPSRTFIYSDSPFRPLGHPVVTIDPNRLASDTLGRSNYPQVMARTIDEAGGDAFVYEYRGTRLARHERRAAARATTCAASASTASASALAPIRSQRLLAASATSTRARSCSSSSRRSIRYLTRMTTRVSPEEMTFDPAFEADPSNLANGSLKLLNNQASLGRCLPSVIDQQKLQAINASQACAATYCGPHGQCVLSANGPACACGEGWVAMQFTDYDSQQSVTCVPATPPVDFRAGGAVLPDACASVSCGDGTCVDRNGIAVCVCDPNTAAAPQIAGTTPICAAWSTPTGGPGAQDYSRPLRALAVCAPKPPACGEGGWLTPREVAIPGVDCGDATPAHALTVEPEKPSCGMFSGCGCQGSPDGTPLAVIGGAWLLGIVVLRRRRA